MAFGRTGPAFARIPGAASFSCQPRTCFPALRPRGRFPARRAGGTVLRPKGHPGGVSPTRRALCRGVFTESASPPGFCGIQVMGAGIRPFPEQIYASSGFRVPVDRTSIKRQRRKTHRVRNDARTGCKTAQYWQAVPLNPNVPGLFVPGVIQRTNHAITPLRRDHRKVGGVMAELSS